MEDDVCHVGPRTAWVPSQQPNRNTTVAIIDIL